MKIIKVDNFWQTPENFTGIVEYLDGTELWCKEGKYHRIDGPAVEYINGQKEWWIEGLRHRTDGPAVEYSNANKEWWIEGKKHRIDGPAVEYKNGNKSWYIDGYYCSPFRLQVLIQNFLYFGKEKGKYNLDWLKFLTEQGIEEFYIIAGMEEDKEFKPLLDKVFEADKE